MSNAESLKDLNLIYVHKFTEKPTIEDIFEVLSKSLDYFGIYFTNQDIVAIKPNLCDLRPYYQGSTTDIRIIQALINIINLQAPEAQIIIIESSHPIAKASEEFETLGYYQLKGNNITFLDLTSEKKTQVAVNGRILERYNMPEIMFKITKLINVPVLKTHVQQRITVSMKNLFGLYAPRFRKRHHPFLDPFLFDIFDIHPPTINIVDGIIGMEGAGPSDGNPIETNLIIVGKNPLFVDYVSSEIMGINPKKVPIIKWAIKKENYDVSTIKVISNSEKIPKYKFKFVPKYAYWGKRLSLSIRRFSSKIASTLASFAGFVDELSLGLVVLLKGYFIATDYGMYTRNDALRYGKGLFLRPFYSLKIKSPFKYLLIKVIFYSSFLLLLGYIFYNRFIS